MAKRTSTEAFAVVDLTLDSDDDDSVAKSPKSRRVAPVALVAKVESPLKKLSSADRAGSSSQKSFIVGATPAPMRSREIIEKLRAWKVPEMEIKKCFEKHELMALLEQYQRAHIGTPPTVPKAGMPTMRSDPATKMESLFSSVGEAPLRPKPAIPMGASGIRPAIPMGAGGVRPAVLSAKNERGMPSSYVSPVKNPGASAKSEVVGDLKPAFRAAGVHSSSLWDEEFARLIGMGHGRKGKKKCHLCGRRSNKCSCGHAGRALGGARGQGARGMLGHGVEAGVGGSGVSKAEELEDAEVGLSHKDADEQTFTEYVPHTFSAPVFQKHPDPVVETASLSSLVPPKTTHKLRLCAKTITQGLLTNLQLETINLACQQHELRLPLTGARGAFFMGDGPGVGKGRQAAGIILENWLQGRERALWLSVSGDLVADARRDIEDIGGKKITCHNLKDFSGKVSLEKQGIKKGILFCTYSLLITDRGASRLQQIVDWCGADAFEGALILDECHRAKNMGNGKSKSDKVGEDEKDDLEAWKKSTATKSATYVASLQQQLPLARIVYLSATGASDPKHFCNLSRLGLWGPGTAFRDQFDFIEEMHKGGIGAMELVAMHMKCSGQYLARSLSFKDATFDIVEVNLTDDFKDMYNRAVEVWQKLIRHPEWWTKASDDGYRKPRNMMGLVWSAHLRFFSQMIMAAKIPEVVALVNKSLADGMCCVIGLQTTGESASGDNVGEKVNELFSNAANAIISLVENYCHNIDDQEKEALLKEIRALSLPPNPLDDLIDKLGGPSKVAEMTGRSQRFVRTNNSWKLTRRVKDDRKEMTINIEERKMFQTGRKLVAIISEAASSGISLQADRRCGNQRRRVHITLQLPWASDQIVQQMGRSHRSNQSSAPMFKLMMTPIGGEWRFASAVARRLQALGALTQGDRRASGTGGRSIQAYNIENSYGIKALKEFMEMVEYQAPLNQTKGTPDFIADAFPVGPGQAPFDSMCRFLEEAHEHLTAAGFGQAVYVKCNSKLKTFLNRVLGVSLTMQNLIFKYFMWLMSERIDKDKSSGAYQDGIIDISGEKIEIVKITDLFECPRTGAKTQRALLRTDRGMGWDKAKEVLKEHEDYAKQHGIDDKDSGFYFSKDSHDHVASVKPVVLILTQRAHQQTASLRNRSYHIIRPNTGNGSQVSDRDHVKHNFTPADPMNPQTQASWKKLYTFYEKNCGHKQCISMSCTYKKRTTQHNIIVGLVLPFWKDIKKCVKTPKVVRVQPTDGSNRLVGIRVWPDKIDELCDMIMRGASQESNCDDREERIVPNPFHDVIKTLAIHDCLNPAARDTITFDLPSGWNKDPDPRNSRQVHCMVFIYEIPLQNALLDTKQPLRPARWKNQDQLRVLNERTMQETVIPVPTNPVPKGAVIAKHALIDDHANVGPNKLRVQSIGERFCVVVQLVALRSVGDVLEQLSVVSDPAGNLEWGKNALLKQLGHGEEDDDDLVVTELDLSLKDPLSCARIKTPARAQNCQHFSCFDLETYLQYGSTYHSFKCQICSKELNPKTIKVCKRFQEILSRTDVEVENCKLNRDFEITNAKCEAKQGKCSAFSTAADTDTEVLVAADQAGDQDQAGEGSSAADVHAGTLEEQLIKTNLWEYTKEAEAFFEPSGASANAGKSTDSDEDANMMDEAESSADEALPVLRRRIRRADDVLPDDNMEDEVESSTEEADEMELVDDAASTTDDEGSGKRRSGAGGSSSKGNSGSSSRSLRSSARASKKPVRYEDPATDEDEDENEDEPLIKAPAVGVPKKTYDEDSDDW